MNYIEQTNNKETKLNQTKKIRELNH